ncbi:uncharacterized protein EI90DRAFT_3061771 [Cantharellus anzutake]|uniref:uncharacterized protein n=1 Tax=Cantharellus anzutake TaxID=1750568 RepID=UPI0019079213|nr:uncharacterized protein EI90DRAFT_3061771 [Cantharellus anzutake]KAF8329747.1 hypothetical protein EI90DRAFT_3061771 [Cantharellus anzutake]
MRKLNARARGPVLLQIPLLSRVLILICKPTFRIYFVTLLALKAPLPNNFTCPSCHVPYPFSLSQPYSTFR